MNRAFKAGGRGLLLGRGGGIILAVFMADVILLRLHNFKMWRRGDRTVVIGHGSG